MGNDAGLEVGIELVVVCFGLCSFAVIVAGFCYFGKCGLDRVIAFGGDDPSLPV